MLEPITHLFGVHRNRTCAISTFALAFLALVAESNAEIHIRHATPRAKLWKKLYEQLPTRWKTTRDILVSVVPESELEKIVASNSNADSSKDEESQIDGCYQNSGSSKPIKITLRDTLRGKEAELVFTHEYAHYIWDELLTEKQRGIYANHWATQKGLNRLMTDYASESVEEGFAEAFAYYLRQPKNLRRKDTLSYQFMSGLRREKSSLLNP